MTDPAEAIRAGALSRDTRAAIPRALDRLEPDAREFWTQALEDPETAEAAGITGAAHLARALSHASGVNVSPFAVRKWRQTTR